MNFKEGSFDESIPGFSHPFLPWPLICGVENGGDLTLDDYVVDYPPSVSGSCRIHKIWSSGTKCNLGAPFGITYIFVQGKDSACLVSGADVWDTRMSCWEFEKILMSLADRRLGDSQAVMHSLCARMREKHGDLDQFAVVSVVLPPEVVSVILPHDELNKEIVFEFDEAGGLGNQAAINLVKESSGSFEKRAIYFLKEAMENDNPLTLVKTIETAISALQYLYDKKFQANEIKVFVVGELGRFKLLLPEEAIVRHLEVINKS